MHACCDARSRVSERKASDDGRNVNGVDCLIHAEHAFVWLFLCIGDQFSYSFFEAGVCFQISKKRKFVNDGVFQAELNEFLSRTLAEDGYSGVEVRVTPIRTEIIIRATRTREVLGEKGRRIRELTSLVQKRFGFPPDSVELFAERVENRGLCAMAQAESLRYKLLKGLAVRRACYGVLRHIMESGAKGALIAVGTSSGVKNICIFKSQMARNVLAGTGWVTALECLCRLRSRRFGKAEGSACQEHEVQRRLHHFHWRAQTALRQPGHQICSAPPGTPSCHIVLYFGSAIYLK